MPRNKLFILIAILAITIIIVLAYFAFRSNERVGGPESGYPASVKAVTSNPVERVTDQYVTIIKHESYLVSYSGDMGDGIFYITVNAEPVVEVSKQAERALMQKLKIDEEYACNLVVIINVPSIIDGDLSEYDFGLSFCPDRPHIEDVPRSVQEYNKYIEDPTIPESENFKVKR